MEYILEPDVKFFDSINYELNMETVFTTIRESRIIYSTNSNEKIKVVTADDAFKLVLPYFYEKLELIEQVYFLLLNRANNVISIQKLSEGGQSFSIVEPKLIVKSAIDLLATGVILFHNHPSGQLKASSVDIATTKKLKSALELFDIRLLDHIIITKENYLSMANDGII